MNDEQILTDSFFQGQVATTLMRLALQQKFSMYATTLLLNKVAEGCPSKIAGDNMKRAILDAWHDTEISNAEVAVQEAQDAQRAAGIIPLSADVMAGPYINLIRPIYAELCERLKLPLENPNG